MTTTPALDAFRAHALTVLAQDPRLEAVLEAGAGAEGRADRYSDLDLVLVARPDTYDGLLAGVGGVAQGLGHLLAAFTGEHVGEPRLLIALFAVPDGDRVLHVDLKVVRRADLSHRVDDPRILLDHQGTCASVMQASPAVWPERAPQWFEDRVWVWLHYGAARAARGEHYEALDMLAYLRSQVPGPMLASAAGHRQRGLRHVESIPGAAQALAATLSSPTPEGLRSALLASHALYVQLRAHQPPPVVRQAAQHAVQAYVERVLPAASR